LGQNLNQVLTAAGVLTFVVNDKDRIKQEVEAAAKMAFEGPAATAVLISQRILGAKTFDR
jgi:sulfopyruvate decarboxylase TPP-binding subunit